MTATVLAAWTGAATVGTLLVLFTLSTVGNLASRSPSEKKLMTPVALLLTICCLIVAFSAGG